MHHLHGTASKTYNPLFSSKMVKFTETLLLPNVIGHIEPCLAQFVTLSSVDKTYSAISSAYFRDKKAKYVLTSFVLRCLQAQLVRTSLCEGCNRVSSI